MADSGSGTGWTAELSDEQLVVRCSATGAVYERGNVVAAAWHPVGTRLILVEKDDGAGADMYQALDLVEHEGRWVVSSLPTAWHEVKFGWICIGVGVSTYVLRLGGILDAPALFVPTGGDVTRWSNRGDRLAVASYEEVWIANTDKSTSFRITLPSSDGIKRTILELFWSTSDRWLACVADHVDHSVPAGDPAIALVDLDVGRWCFSREQFENIRMVEWGEGDDERLYVDGIRGNDQGKWTSTPIDPEDQYYSVF